MNSTINVTNAVPPVKTAARWQVSVRSLLIFTTLCCGTLAAITFPTLAIISLLVALSCLATFCLVAAVYGRGWIRPFSVLTGTTLLFGAMFVANVGVHGPGGFLIALLILLLLATFVGIIGAAMHGFLQRRFGIVPVPNVRFLEIC